jgi:hypothetical protein
MSSRTRLGLGAVLLTGLVVRVVWCVYAARPPVGLHDPSLYRLFGEQLANGVGYRLPDGSPTAYYPIGYPMALAAVFWLTPPSWGTGMVAAFNITAQLVAVLLTFAMTRRLCDGRDLPALVAAGALALWPNLVLHTSSALTESLFLPLMLAAVLLALEGPWAERRFSGRRLVAIGALLGAATLVRPVSVPLLGALLAGWLVAGFGWRRSLAHVAVVAAVLVGTQVPWVIRNAVVMDAPVVSTNAGDNLCMSRRVGGSGGFEFPNPRCFSGPFDELDRPEYETERDAHGRRLALEFVREHPGEELRLMWRRLVVTLKADDDAVAAAESYGEDPFLTDDTRSTLQAVANGWYAIVGSAGLAGLALLAWRRRPEDVVVVLSTVGLLLAPVLFFGDPRFHVPALPFVAVGLGVLVNRFAERSTPAPEELPQEAVRPAG